MLQELSESDSKWRQIALNICKDKSLADDIVQDMYFKLVDYPRENIRSLVPFVTVVMRRMAINIYNKKKDTSLTTFHYLESNDNAFEPDDYEQEILDNAALLTWSERELLEEVYDRSYREIEEIYNIDHCHSFRKVRKARNKILNK
ncbi:unnamed protein product [marine sediment metagenome]|uniref:RNA polymerase sigma-70 region 2 domain-containing protein n=1 Tax=marine sediment metagenome TaxID=412755 RepID=X0WC74_9ZZZZ